MRKIKVKEELADLGRMVTTRWARRRLKGAPVRSLTLSLTYRCNARCEMCYVWKKDSEKEKQREMKLEHIERLAASRFMRRLVALGLTGGETFLYEQLPEVIELFCRYGPPRYVSLATNGFLPERTKEIVRSILEHQPVELWVNVSVDALDELHNQIRGLPNVLERTKTTLETLAEMRKDYPQLGVGILFTLQPQNYSQMVDVFHYARRLGVQFNMNPINYGEEYYERDPGVVFKEYSRMLPEIEEQLRQIDRESPDDLFGREFRALFRPYVLSGAKPVIPCFAGVANAFITPPGDVFPCVPARKDFYMGNIKEKSFDEIWQSEAAEEVRRRIGRGICKCLITCETSTALRYSMPYQFKRVARLLKPRGGPGDPDGGGRGV